MAFQNTSLEQRPTGKVPRRISSQYKIIQADLSKQCMKIGIGIELSSIEGQRVFAKVVSHLASKVMEGF